jgi:hypothetical protein
MRSTLLSAEADESVCVGMSVQLLLGGIHQLRATGDTNPFAMRTPQPHTCQRPCGFGRSQRIAGALIRRGDWTVRECFVAPLTVQSPFGHARCSSFRGRTTLSRCPPGGLGPLKTGMRCCLIVAVD